jgi:peptide chain release factor 1
MRRLPKGAVFSSEIASDLSGTVVLRVCGEGAGKLFSKESGGHRWQGPSPTEKRGRVHTSSITVAVMGVSEDVIDDIDPADVVVDTFIGQGPGGQHRQKNATAVRMTHIPTGTVVCCENERSLQQNKRFASEALSAKVREAVAAQIQNEQNSARRGQIGTGYRGDKIRTVQLQNDRVTNHLTGRRCSAKQYLKGRLDLIQ